MGHGSVLHEGGVGVHGGTEAPSTWSGVQQDPWGPSGLEEVDYRAPRQASQWTPAEASLNNVVGGGPPESGTFQGVIVKWNQGAAVWK